MLNYLSGDISLSEICISTLKLMPSSRYSNWEIDREKKRSRKPLFSHCKIQFFLLILCLSNIDMFNFIGITKPNNLIFVWSVIHNWIKHINISKEQNWIKKLLYINERENLSFTETIIIIKKGLLQKTKQNNRSQYHFVHLTVVDLEI